jgi:hypothetical protein
MKNMMLIIAFVLSAVFFYFGYTAWGQIKDINDQKAQLEASNLALKASVEAKKNLVKQGPVPISTEYGLLVNQVRLLASYSGTEMNVQVDGVLDATDISTHYEQSEYKGVRGLKIEVVVSKFDNDTDMGAVLDDIHQLETNADFLATEITKDNSSLIIKGEIYGL